MPFPDESAIMSRDPHQRRTATLFVESWPAPAPDSPEMPPLAYPAPHVIACSNASVLLDLHRGDIDMVVWGRIVPDVWHKALAAHGSSRTVFDMCGTCGELVDALTSRMLTKEFPPLILGDAAELSSLFSAVTKDCPQRLRLATTPPDDVAFEAASGALRLICCYGAACAEWCSYPDPRAGMTSTLDSFSVAFIKVLAVNTLAACIAFVARVTTILRPAFISSSIRLLDEEYENVFSSTLFFHNSALQVFRPYHVGPRRRTDRSDTRQTSAFCL